MFDVGCSVYLITWMFQCFDFQWMITKFCVQGLTCIGQCHDVCFKQYTSNKVFI